MGLFRSGHRNDDDPGDTREDEVVTSPGRPSIPNRLQMRRSSGLSRNGSARSVSCSAKTIKIGTGQSTFGGSGDTTTTGITNSTRSANMHQSIDRFRAIYQNDDDLNLSHKSFVSELDLESPEMAPIGEGSHENEETKRVAGLGPQHDPNLQDTVGTTSELVSADFTLTSGSNHNCGHSRYSNANNSRRSQNSKTSLPSLAKSMDSMNDASGDLFDNLSYTSNSVMLDKERAEKLGKSGTRFVYIILLIMGILFTTGTALLSRWIYSRKFELEFLSFARETADMAETNAAHIFSQLETMATTITSEGLLERERTHQHDHHHNEEISVAEASWPNVTIPHFDQRIEDFSMAFGATMLMYVPLVQAKDRETWEQYANEHAPWKTPAATRNDALDYTPIATSVSLGVSSKDNNTDHSSGVGNDDYDHDHDHDGSDRDRWLHETSSFRAMSEDFKNIHPITNLNIDESRPGFADIDAIMITVLENQGGFEDSQGISAPIYQYGGPGRQRTEDSDIALMDLWTHPIFQKEVITSIEYDVPVISEYMDLEFFRDALSTVDPDGNATSLWDSKDTLHEKNHTNSQVTPDLTLPSVRSLTLHAVKESFKPGAKTVGFVVGVVPWSAYFQNVLRTSKTLSTVSNVTNDSTNRNAIEVNGIVVKVVSDCGSIFTFVLNSGDEPSEVRLGDWREQYEKYEHLEYASPFFWKEHPKNLSRHCHFDLYIYPNEEFEAMYQSNAWIFSLIVAGIFLITSVIFAFYDAFIFKAQRHIVNEATGLIIANAQRAAKNERELNDFIAHEVRNPLAAAISACSFVSSAIMDDQKRRSYNVVRNNITETINEAEKLALIDSDEKRKEVLDDVNIIDSSLHFINDLLRNMLDMQRAGSNQIHIEKKPTDIMNDVLKPVEAMMNLRDVPFKVILECNNGLQNQGDEDDDEEQLFVMTDPMRLKQILLNLARNSTKFVKKGFIRCSANVNPINGFVELRVDDSGPGIPPEKRNRVFGKFQQSLDSLQQGTGIGLSLCRKLTDLMGGCLFIDEDYNSGIEGCLGTRFVIQLKIPPLQLNKMMFEPKVSVIDRARLRRRQMLENTETHEKPSSMNSMENLTDSAHSSMSSFAKEVPADASFSEIESTPRVQEPAVNVTESSDDVGPTTKTPEDGSSMLPLPNTLRQTSTEHNVNFSSDSIDGVNKASSKITELPKNFSVLFVDDDMVLRKLFSRVLKKINPTWNCKEASSGEAAIELLTSNAECNNGFQDEDGNAQEEGDCGFDLIFMDQYMASVQKQLLGTETVRAIRAKGFNKPIICGLSANDVEDAFYHAGSDAFMFKPFPCKKDELEKELLKVINSGVRRR
mmetsp:Transcript_950/g.2038  ORF Transcript_950/g.2038 Transcript_950/m.2038 type:complete len:1340 (+) Transcript_950:473-4492(+)|eukprot:CAMPEP_0197184282 /NCGR_PEP_ID=MMETSP1423-20130617/9550_1 /TAXON_ID=476441 /ORGANISM="Pseudo-nitzschia heimii, Strain UNC1101" /LENGTH=1339 /DNA_ID=CAMNT_0042635059 /DNA_START=408 /DNA_END=4427 /DNA_ORIENTATION=+